MEINKETVADYVIACYQKGLDPTQKEAFKYFCVGKTTLEKRLKKLGTSFSTIKKECRGFFNTQPFIDEVYNFLENCRDGKDGVESCATYLGLTKRGFLEKLKRYGLKYKELKAEYYSQEKAYKKQQLTEIEINILCLHYGIYCIDSGGYSIPEVAVMLDIRKNKAVTLLRSALRKIKNSESAEVLKEYY